MRSAPAPAAAPDLAVEAAAHGALGRRLDPGSSAPVVVALSGGGDSVALLGLAAGWARACERPLIAVHVDHGLNPASREWTRFAAEAATRAGAGFVSARWAGEKPSTGLPAAARAARHCLLAEAARAAGAHVILTGHTLDDVAEGERMREGDAPSLGHLREWSPSPAWPEGRGLFLLRPLLGIRREALREWLRARGEMWIEDPANEDVRFARARARHTSTQPPHPPTLFERGPLPLPNRERVTSDGRITLPRRGLDPTVLSAALLCAAGTGRPPRGLQIERLMERLAGAGPVDATLAGARLAADAATVQIGRDAGERFRGGLAPLDGPGVWDGRFEIAHPGRIEALGGLMARLDHRDRARLKAIPAWARGALPALVSPEGAVRLACQARSLAQARLEAACGVVTREADIGAGAHGASSSVTLCSGPSALSNRDPGTGAAQERPE